MNKFKKINDEVFYTKNEITSINYQDINFLKSNANKNSKKRIRICTHSDDHDKLHEMFIALSKSTYIRPHRHYNKSESLHVIYGSADVVFFDDKGDINKIINLSKDNPDSFFYYRIDKPIYHTFFLKSDFFIFHETTEGPFIKTKTEYASWSPQENETDKIILFNAQIKKKIENFY